MSVGTLLSDYATIISKRSQNLDILEAIVDLNTGVQMHTILKIRIFCGVNLITGSSCHTFPDTSDIKI